MLADTAEKHYARFVVAARDAAQDRMDMVWGLKNAGDWLSNAGGRWSNSGHEGAIWLGNLVGQSQKRP
jgi:hypothetical protein